MFEVYQNYITSKCDICAFDSPPSKRSPQCKTCTVFSNFKLKNNLHPIQESMWERYKLNAEFERGIKMAVKPCCDFCDKPLEFVDGRYVIYRTKELNTRELLPHLCKKCADGLDKIIAESRSRLMREGEIVQRVTELNKARRERLGTKG